MGFGTGIALFFGGFWSIIKGIFKIFFFKWKFTLSIIFLLFSLSGSVVDSFNQGSLKPFLFEAGGFILSADEGTYYQMIELENNNFQIPTQLIDKDEKDGFMKDLKSIFAKFSFIIDIIGRMWWVVTFVFLIYYLFRVFNSSAILQNWIIAIFVVVFLQAAYAEALLFINYDCPGAGCIDKDARISSIGLSLVPLKGIAFSEHSFFYHLFISGKLWKVTFKEPATAVVFNDSSAEFS